MVLLAGGTGGAKLAHGFQQALPPGALSVVVNVADDFELLGLHVSPDIDSVLYTLAGMIDPERGWGIAGDTWSALGMLARYAEPTWFRVGDADLGTHLHRTRLLAGGTSLSAATAAMARELGIASAVMPASDDPIRTLVRTDEGEIEFQRYFVERGQRDTVRGVRFVGIEAARPAGGVLAALAAADLVVIGPSNPLVSIDPIIEIPGMRDAMLRAHAPRVAVSPIVGGRALKGPADRMLGSLGQEVSALGVARRYAGLVDHFVIDTLDAALAPAIESLGMAVRITRTVMRTDADRAALAAELLHLAG